MHAASALRTGAVRKALPLFEERHFSLCVFCSMRIASMPVSRQQHIVDHNHEAKREDRERAHTDSEKR